jgi:hypothetical protein
MKGAGQSVEVGAIIENRGRRLITDKAVSYYIAEEVD